MEEINSCDDFDRVVEDLKKKMEKENLYSIPWSLILLDYQHRTPRRYMVSFYSFCPLIQLHHNEINYL